jgi:hypothetical protein
VPPLTLSPMMLLATVELNPLLVTCSV